MSGDPWVNMGIHGVPWSQVVQLLAGVAVAGVLYTAFIVSWWRERRDGRGRDRR